MNPEYVKKACSISIIALTINISLFLFMISNLRKLKSVPTCLNVLSIMGSIWFLIIPILIFVKYYKITEVTNLIELEEFRYCYIVMLNLGRQTLYVLLAYRLYFNFDRTTYAISFKKTTIIVTTFIFIQYCNFGVIDWSVRTSRPHVLLGMTITYYAFEISFNMWYTYGFVYRLISILQHHFIHVNDIMENTCGIMSDELFNLAIRSFLISCVSAIGSVVVCVVLSVGYITPRQVFGADIILAVESVTNTLVILLYFEFSTKIYNAFCLPCHKMLQYLSMKYLFSVALRQKNSITNKTEMEIEL